MNYEKTILEVINSQDLPKTDQENLIKLAYMMGQRDAMEMSVNDVKKLINTYDTLIQYFSPSNSAS